MPDTIIWMEMIMSTPSLERPPVSAPPSSVLPPCAVLIDGSALFLASSSRNPEGRRLNYFGLIDLLVSNIEGLRPPSPDAESVWSMWTSADPGNAGQSKFLDFAANRLRWQIRATHPSQAFMMSRMPCSPRAPTACAPAAWCASTRP